MNTQRQLLLGIFFIVALSILAFYTLFLTDIHVFSKPVLMTVYFEDANNLREGDPVQLLGARIGRVKEVSANPAVERRKRVTVVLSLDSEVELLEDASISIRETSLLGGRHVAIEPGTFGGPVLGPTEDGGYFGQVYKNPIAAFGDIGEQLGVVLSENRENIRKTIENVEAISAGIRAGNGIVGRLVNDETMGEDARRLVANVAETSDQLKSGKGLLGALFYDETIRQQFGDAVASLKQLGDDLKAQKGIAGALVYDEALKQRVTHGIDQLVSFSEKLNGGDGALALLMNDPTTKEQVRTLIADFSSTMGDVRTLIADTKGGKGTLGKLFTEDALYQELTKAVAVLSRSLEDYREAAPITAFTSVLFAAF